MTRFRKLWRLRALHPSLNPSPHAEREDALPFLRARGKGSGDRGKTDETPPSNLKPHLSGLSLLCLTTLLIGLLLPLATVRPPARAQDDGAVPLPVAPFGAHPRLLITQAYINQTLKPRAAADVETWTALVTYAASDEPEANIEWSAGETLRSLALMWLVTEDGNYALRAKTVILALLNRIEKHPTMASNGGFDGQFMADVAALAVGYDWLYHALTDNDRALLRDTLWRAAKRLRNPTADQNGLVWIDDQLSAFGNYDARWLWALSATGLALWGEHDDAVTLLAFCRQMLVDSVIPALDIQEGGAWAEGPVYGFIAIWPKVQTALAFWTAAGENYFDDTDWWYDRLAYDLFLYHPAQARTYNEDWGDLMPGYPSIIGDSERYHTAYVYGRAQDLLLHAVFEGYEYANWMAWFLRQPLGAMPDWMAVEEFLWRDPNWPGVPPAQTTWFAPYNGHVFMRSNWIDANGQLDTTATYVSFNAGDRLAYHQFYDQGNFTIFHNNEELVVRSGVYSGDGTSDHDANYYARTIAANTILVCDLAESFDGIRPNGERDIWLNDCGQRAMSPASRTAINVEYLVENWRAYDTGSIIRFAEHGDVTYLRADITGAYNSTLYTTPDNSAKVSSVIREFVYWRPGSVLISDRVNLTYPAFTPLVVFHFQNEPSPSGLFFGSLVRESAVYMQNLKPNSTVTMVPGFEVSGQMIDKSWGEPVSNNFERDPYGFFRLELSSGQPDTAHWFLTAFRAQDASEPPPPEGLLVLGDTMRGAVMGTIQVMFDLTPEDGRDVIAATFQIGPGVEYALLTGLVPGAAYVVEGEARSALTLTADDAGTILIPNTLPGGVRLSLQDS